METLSGGLDLERGILSVLLFLERKAQAQMLLCIEGTTPADGAEKLCFHFTFRKLAGFKGPDVKAVKWP